MYKIKTINNISKSCMDILDKNKYVLGDDLEDPEVIFVRATSLLDYDFNPSLLCVARAGIGVNTIPLERLAERGVVVCTTGIGVSMVANKVKGVRCALCMNPDMAKMTRLHNNANMIALGQKYVDVATAKEIVDNFLTTPFEGGRHSERVGKIEM